MSRSERPPPAPPLGGSKTPQGWSAPGPELFWPETEPQIWPIPPLRHWISKVVLQIRPASAGFSHKISGVGDSADCVAADAVAFEPVSAAKFPANREKNRDYFNSGAVFKSHGPISPMILGL